jgi:hypothetical protein
VKIQVNIPDGAALDAITAMAKENGTTVAQVVTVLAMRRAMMRVHVEMKRAAGEQLRAAIVANRQATGAGKGEAERQLAAARVAQQKTKSAIAESRRKSTDAILAATTTVDLVTQSTVVHEQQKPGG